MHCQLPACDRQSVVIVRREALGRADFDTKIADAAFETIDLPFLVLLADNYGIGWATSAAQAAEDASINSVNYFPPGNQWKNPDPLWVHECGRPCEKVPGYSFRHRKYFHCGGPSPFRATDAWVQGKNDIRHVSNFRSFQNLDH